LPVVLYGFETWPVILREEHRLRVLKNGMLRKTSGPKRDDVQGSAKDCTMRSFIIYTHQMLFG